MHEFQFYWQPFDSEQIYTVDAIYWPPIKAVGEFWGAKFDDSDPAEITITEVKNQKKEMVFDYDENECKEAAFEAFEKQLSEIE